MGKSSSWLTPWSEQSEELLLELVVVGVFVAGVAVAEFAGVV